MGRDRCRRRRRSSQRRQGNSSDAVVSRRQGQVPTPRHVESSQLVTATFEEGEGEVRLDGESSDWTLAHSDAGFSYVSPETGILQIGNELQGQVDPLAVVLAITQGRRGGDGQREARLLCLYLGDYGGYAEDKERSWGDTQEDDSLRLSTQTFRLTSLSLPPIPVRLRQTTLTSLHDQSSTLTTLSRPARLSNDTPRITNPSFLFRISVSTPLHSPISLTYILNDS